MLLNEWVLLGPTNNIIYNITNLPNIPEVHVLPDLGHGKSFVPRDTVGARPVLSPGLCSKAQRTPPLTSGDVVEFIDDCQLLVQFCCPVYKLSVYPTNKGWTG